MIHSWATIVTSVTLTANPIHYIIPHVQVIGNTMAHSMWRELQLNNNRLGSVGAAALVKGLAHNSSLKQLALQVCASLHTNLELYSNFVTNNSFIN